MNDEIRAMWPRFDELAAKAESADMRLPIEAIKLQTGLMNMRLGAIESLDAAQMRQAGAAAMNPLGARR
jgi:hypothetical protein